MSEKFHNTNTNNNNKHKNHNNNNSNNNSDNPLTSRRTDGGKKWESSLSQGELELRRKTLNLSLSFLLLHNFGLEFKICSSFIA